MNLPAIETGKDFVRNSCVVIKTDRREDSGRYGKKKKRKKEAEYYSGFFFPSRDHWKRN